MDPPELLAPGEPPELPWPPPLLLSVPDDEPPLALGPPSPAPASTLAGLAVEPQPIARYPKTAIRP